MYHRTYQATYARPFAVVTAASSKLGLELARCCARDGFDLLVVADDPLIEDIGATLRVHGTAVQTVQADPSTPEGLDQLSVALGSRQVHALLVHAGHGLDQVLAGAGPQDPGPFVKTYLKGIMELTQRMGQRMSTDESGHVLLVGPTGCDGTGPLQALCGGTRLFIAGFADALRQEFEGNGLTITCCMPSRLGYADPLTPDLAHPSDRTQALAQVAFDAMMQGDTDVATQELHEHATLPMPGAWQVAAGQGRRAGFQPGR